ncbi:peptidase domain-containing ABC transporter [Bacillus pseudomycoides]
MKYIHTKQQEKYDCGIACVASILKYYGITYGMDYLKDQIITKNGYSLKDLISLFNHFSYFSCRAIEIDIKYIEEAFDDIEMPCIALTNQGTKEYYEGHYVIVYKKKKNTLIISDPTNERITKISIDEFKTRFTGIFLLVNKKEYSLNHIEDVSYQYNFFKELLKKNKFSIMIVFILSALFVLLSIGNSFFFKILIDDILPGHFDYFLLQLTLIFLGVNLLNNLFDYLRIYLINKTAIKLDKSISKEYFNQIIKLPITFFENREDGDIISRFNDAGYIRNLVNVAFVSIILNSVIILGIGIVLYLINVTLFFTVLSLALILISLTIMYYDVLQKRNKDFMSKKASTQSYLIQFIKNMVNIYSLNKKEYFITSFNKVFNHQLDSTMRESVTNINNNGIKKLVQSSFSIIILFIGAKQIMADSISLGDLLFINALTMFMMDSLGGLIELQSTIQKALVAKERVLDVMNYPLVETDEANQEIKKVKKININGLSFNISDYCIIENINIDIYENEKLIFIGESGSGKTTFSKLLNKLYPVNLSQIFINDIDINYIKDTNLRNEIIYLNENPFLFKATIMENLCMGEHYTENEIINACKLARIYDFINSLPNKFDFLINDSNSNLSTGQKQRLCLARAILHKPSVLILDESLSNVDSYNFQQIYEGLYKLDLILIFITHNPELLTKYDRKFLFKDKCILDLSNYSDETIELEVTK